MWSLLRAPTRRARATRTTSPPSARSPSPPTLGDQLADDLTFIERQLLRAANLIGLVTLAREDDDVVRTGELQRARNGRAAVLDALVRLRHAGFDVIEDALRIFG